MDWKLIKDSYSGNLLKKVVKLEGEDGFIEAELYWRPHHEEKTQSNGIKWKEATGMHEPYLHVSVFRASGSAYSSGIGKFYNMGAPEHRRTVKKLQSLAASMDDAYIKAISSNQNSKPTLVVGATA